MAKGAFLLRHVLSECLVSCLTVDRCSAMLVIAALLAVAVVAEKARYSVFIEEFVGSPRDGTSLIGMQWRVCGEGSIQHIIRVP